MVTGRNGISPAERMTPENLNRLSMWATITVVVVAGLMFAGRWAFGDTNESYDGPPVLHLAAHESSSTTAPPVAVEATEAPESMDTTTTEPRPSIVLSEYLRRTGVEEPDTTTAPTTAAPTTLPPTGTATPTTTIAPPPEIEPIPVALPTPPDPTTTTTQSTTTTTQSTTTTTLVPTTTTSATTTSTTTTTVVSDLPGIFLERFDGQPQGDSDEWSVRVDVTLGATVAGTYRGQVSVSWSGDGSGSVVLDTGGSGKASATVGPFSGDPVTLRVTNVQAAGWSYMPSLNQAPTTLTIAAPDDD